MSVILALAPIKLPPPSPSVIKCKGFPYFPNSIRMDEDGAANDDVDVIGVLVLLSSRIVDITSALTPFWCMPAIVLRKPPAFMADADAFVMFILIIPIIPPISARRTGTLCHSSAVTICLSI